MTPIRRNPPTDQGEKPRPVGVGASSRLQIPLRGQDGRPYSSGGSLKAGEPWEYIFSIQQGPNLGYGFNLLRITTPVVIQIVLDEEMQGKKEKENITAQLSIVEAGTPLWEGQPIKKGGGTEGDVFQPVGKPLPGFANYGVEFFFSQEFFNVIAYAANQSLALIVKVETSLDPIEPNGISVNGASISKLVPSSVAGFGKDIVSAPGFIGYEYM